MASFREVLRSQDGVVLSKRTQQGGRGLLAVAYSVTSRRTPAGSDFIDRGAAAAHFVTELALYQKPS